MITDDVPDVVPATQQPLAPPSSALFGADGLADLTPTYSSLSAYGSADAIELTPAGGGGGAQRGECNTIATTQQQVISTQSPPQPTPPSQPLPRPQPTEPQSELPLTNDMQFLSESYSQAVAGAGGRAGAVPPRRTVLLPWAPGHRFQAPNLRMVSCWDRAMAVLEETPPISVRTPRELTSLMRALQPDVLAGNALLLGTLEDAFARAIPTALAAAFFNSAVPWMFKRLEGAPALFASNPPMYEGAHSSGERVTFPSAPGELPVLVAGVDGAVRMTQAQAATLLVCGFFSLVPYRYHHAGLRYAGGKGAPRSPFASTDGPAGEGAALPAFNFNGLFGARYFDHERRPQDPLWGKIACLVQYFVTMAATWDAVEADGLRIEVVRSARSQEEVRAAFASAADALLSPVVADDALLIEACEGQLQADFANRHLGGGVLGKGCVQEEIRMVICPELLIGLLVCEPMRSREAVYLSGCAQYSRYDGYARTFAFGGAAAVPPPTPRELAVGMRNVAVVAFDALNFNSGGLRPADQYAPRYIEAEIVKAYVAFSGNALLTLAAAAPTPADDAAQGAPSLALHPRPLPQPPMQSHSVATGHWGCGAFGGDRELKFLIQLCAASYAGRRAVTYCTFGDVAFTDRCRALCARLVEWGATASILHRTLVAFEAQRGAFRTNSVFDYCTA